MKSGKYIYFRDGKYATDEVDEIEELEAAIKAKHPHIFISKGEEQISAKKMNDPLAEIKEKAIAEYLASQNRDMGTSESKPLAGMATSASLQNLKESNSKGK
jgi:hypothetical protein